MKVFSSSTQGLENIICDELKKGSLIAYPTDTIYGVGCDALNNQSIEKINLIKGRNAPMTIAISGIEMIQNKLNFNNWKEINKILKDGSTCIVKEKRGAFSSLITKDGNIGFRVPQHPLLQSIIQLFNSPITTTSINRTGSEPLTEPQKILKEFGTEIDILIDDGKINNSPSKIYLFKNNGFERIR